MPHPPGHPENGQRPLSWEDLFVGAMMLGGAGSAVLLFFSPLIGALLFLELPFNFLITGIYASLFCYLAFKAIQDIYSDDDADTTLKFRIEG